MNRFNVGVLGAAHISIKMNVWKLILVGFVEFQDCSKNEKKSYPHFAVTSDSMIRELYGSYLYYFLMKRIMLRALLLHKLH